MNELLITNRIRQLRVTNGEMTQQDLARRVGVTRQTIIALEAHRYTPSLRLAIHLARVFKTNIDDVFQYVDHDGENGKS